MSNVHALPLRLSRLTLALAVSLAGGLAHAGVTIVSQRGAAGPSTLYIEGNKMRIEAAGQNGQATSVLVDGQAKKLIMIDEKAKTYTEMTEEDMKKMKVQVEAMRAQMQERMKSMPPDQRRKMEALMGSLGGPAGGKPPKPPVLKFEKAGGKKTINGFSCEMYRVLKDGTATEEDCISPWSAGVIQKADLAALRKFGEEMLKDFGGAGNSELALDQLDKYPGIPISRVPLDDKGGRGEEEQIKSIQRGAVAAAKLAVPAGFTKKALPAGALSGGGGPPKGNFRPMPQP